MSEFVEHPLEAYRPHTTIHRRVTVARIIDSRYGASGERPLSWDKRKEGIDHILTVDGEELTLWSDGGQSCPRKGWIILLRGKRETGEYLWTLYGLTQDAEKHVS